MANDSKTQLNVKTKIEEKLAQYFGVTPSDASNEQMYKAISMTVLDQLLEKKEKFNKAVKAASAKKVYYLCNRTNVCFKTSYLKHMLS